MKALLASFGFISAFALSAVGGHELPMFGPVPMLSDEWRVSERTNHPPRFDGGLRMSRLVLTNSSTGDFLSFSAEKLDGKPFSKANRVPWSDMAGDSFPGGDTTRSKPAGYDPVVHWLRNEVIDIAVVDTNRNTNFKEQALQYTLIFEDRSSPSRLAHGYMIPMGNFRILAQHTSTNVVTSEFAHSIISAMLWDFVNQRSKTKTTEIKTEAGQ